MPDPNLVIAKNLYKESLRMITLELIGLSGFAEHSRSEASHDVLVKAHDMLYRELELAREEL